MVNRISKRVMDCWRGKSCTPQGVVGRRDPNHTVCLRIQKHLISSLKWRIRGASAEPQEKFRWPRQHVPLDVGCNTQWWRQGAYTSEVFKRSYPLETVPNSNSRLSGPGRPTFLKSQSGICCDHSIRQFALTDDRTIGDVRGAFDMCVRSNLAVGSNGHATVDHTSGMNDRVAGNGHPQINRCLLWIDNRHTA